MIMQIWVYFYLVYRDCLEQSPHDKLDHESKVVTLGKRSVRHLKNGLSVGKLLLCMRRSVYQGQPPMVQQVFQLDPLLGNLPDTLKASVLQRSWSLVRRNIKKFGIEVFRHSADLIIASETPYEVVHLVKFLIDFEKGGGCVKIAQAIQQCFQVSSKVDPATLVGVPSGKGESNTGKSPNKSGAPPNENTD
jgi:hypothetical protein